MRQTGVQSVSELGDLGGATSLGLSCFDGTQ